MEELKEECGVFGVYDNNNNLDVARMVFFSLYALQHRGQESCGIAVSSNKEITGYKNMGLVSEVFNNNILNSLQGRQGIGQVRYSTTGASNINNAQPYIVHYRDGMMAVAHNGNLVNTEELRQKMYDDGEIMISGTDTALIVMILARNLVSSPSIEKAVEKTMAMMKGSYAMVVLLEGKLLAFRDPWGLRPLCLGKLRDSYVISSESCAFPTIGATFVRDIAPGEIIIVDEDGLHSYQTKTSGVSAICVFEYVYFARPDSYIDGASVHAARMEAGRILAREYPVEADLVIGAPDSAISGALGYAQESGIHYGQGLIRNRYVGRTFIKPTQELRDAAVRIKFSALRNEIEGKRVVMLDDSIVRGTTTRIIVQMLKNAGAEEVHMRISSPPIKFSCYYGIDTSTSSQLIASKLSVEEIRKMIGADSLGYLSLEGLLKTPVGIKGGLCDACFTGNYCAGCCKQKA